MDKISTKFLKRDIFIEKWTISIGKWQKCFDASRVGDVLSFLNLLTAIYNSVCKCYSISSRFEANINDNLLEIDLRS